MLLLCGAPGEAVFPCAVLQASILCRSLKLMARTNTVITLLKLLSVAFIVAVGIAGVVRRGEDLLGSGGKIYNWGSSSNEGQA